MRYASEEKPAASRIEALVKKIKMENERNGEADKNKSDLQLVMGRFAMLRGNGPLANDVLEIKK